jgi:hypothetical protein
MPLEFGDLTFCDSATPSVTEELQMKVHDVDSHTAGQVYTEGFAMLIGPALRC